MSVWSRGRSYLLYDVSKGQVKRFHQAAQNLAERNKKRKKLVLLRQTPKEKTFTLKQILTNNFDN